MYLACHALRSKEGVPLAASASDLDIVDGGEGAAAGDAGEGLRRFDVGGAALRATGAGTAAGASAILAATPFHQGARERSIEGIVVSSMSHVWFSPTG